MPRIYKRKTTRGASNDVLERALEYMTTNNTSVRSAARDFKIDRTTFQRFVNKKNADPDAVFGYVNCRLKNMVFTPEMETDLSQQIKQLAGQFYGLSKSKVQEVAYLFAKANDLNIPPQWETNKKAGQHFWLSFKERNRLTIRSPEATSMARASAFNQHTAKEFFTNLARVMDKHKFAPQDIYNIDESGLHTVQKPESVVTGLGTKRVGSVTSAERGELVTVVYGISAAGVVIPPMFIFPRVKYNERFIVEAPNGSTGAARSGGWINEEIFLQYLDHIIIFTRCSKEHKILIIMDNHETHISLSAVDKARENGIVFLTIPPHTSHKLQPLDRTCFGPFKKAYNKAMDNWIRSYPAKTVTIYDIPRFAAEAHNKAFTPENINSGFSCTGIFPYNDGVFPETEFAASNVTDRPTPEPEFEEEIERFVFPDEPVTVTPNNQQPSQTENSSDENDGTNPTMVEEPEVRTHSPATPASPTQPPTTSTRNATAIPSTSAIPRSQTTPGRDILSEAADGECHTSPQEIIPFLKAEARKTAPNCRRRRYSKVVTDTPNRDEIASRKAPKLQTQKNEVRRSIFELTQESSDSEDLDVNELCNLPSDNEVPADEDDPTIELTQVSNVSVNAYILCRFATRKTLKFYVAKVLEGPDSENDLQVKFLKRLGKQNKFVFSEEEAASFPLADVNFVFPNPNSQGTTSRTKHIMTFPVNLGDLNIL